ncbi:hypothetical protein Daura_01465 [Dactylosporangium aurantiacum]|uniref:Uncharacterized protein n=1 Tax=Dactylosporangium aurantiacum TaxID=35754 RepID=A0A9Q9MFY6_9ACTN|nr:hypothetical protein [Dactylosporangium aurantiacum]MDG6100966.1 hypothetical protein [Dactylosporangium aurantiacum]UWZ54984.1 hypothetical protein Daura_01465 [Dactylosporangium aurantiacum]
MSTVAVVNVVVANGTALGGLVSAIMSWRASRPNATTVRVTIKGADGVRSISVTGPQSLTDEVLRRLLDPSVPDAAPPPALPVRRSRIADGVTRLLALGLPAADQEQWREMWREDLYYDRAQGRSLRSRAGTYARIALHAPELIWTLRVERRRAVD